MTTIEKDPSLEEKLREYLRLRKKHAPASVQGRFYREAIREQIQKLRAIRLARQANRDLVLPPFKKSLKGRPNPTETGSAN